jgi:aromatic ring-opening dioxygenase catalytic subunit (LigB family)
MRLPSLYIPHGGGPCLYMDWTMGPRDTWDRMAGWLRGLEGTLPERPRALLVVSAHWEMPVATVTTSVAPPLLYDYYGFPPHTYELKWPAPGSPELAGRVRKLLSGAGFESGEDAARGLDHGVFVPLKLSFPEAQVPTVQLSLREGLDPAQHLAMGRALEPLRDEGVLIIGSGMSYHNMRGFNAAASRDASLRFDRWLAGVVAEEPSKRDAALAAWTKAPSARECHPREEHLLPLMVAAGAAGDDRGRASFSDEVMGVAVSAVAFG